jgi:DNA-binding response OmpR family regulator
MKALVVDDDRVLADVLAFTLRREGFQVIQAFDGEAALERWAEEQPDMIVLDVNLPKMDGFAVCRRIREEADTPILLVTVRGEEDDIVHGLKLGADDYITKPFDLDVLLARIKTVLRRSQHSVDIPAEPTRLAVGDLEIDPSAHTVTVGGRSLNLPPREFDLLYTLASEAGHVISVHDLLARVWGAEYQNQSQVVYVHMRWLREKLEEDPRHPRRIVTVRSVGYKLEPQGV